MNGFEFFTSWLTPAVLFCVLNLVIGTIFIISSLKPHPKQRTLGDNEDEQTPPQLGRVPSFLERVKSVNLSRFRSDHPDSVSCANPAEEQSARQREQDHESEDLSQTSSKCQAEAARPTAPARVLKKSASGKSANRSEEENEGVQVDRLRPATVREKSVEFSGGDEAVDEKADDFINRFRQQLKLQRLDSILRYKRSGSSVDRGMGS